MLHCVFTDGKPSFCRKFMLFKSDYVKASAQAHLNAPCLWLPVSGKRRWSVGEFWWSRRCSSADVSFENASGVSLERLVIARFITSPRISAVSQWTLLFSRDRSCVIWDAMLSMQPNCLPCFKNSQKSKSRTLPAYSSASARASRHDLYWACSVNRDCSKPRDFSFE